MPTLLSRVQCSWGPCCEVNIFVPKFICWILNVTAVGGAPPEVPRLEEALEVEPSGGLSGFIWREQSSACENTARRWPSIDQGRVPWHTELASTLILGFLISGTVINSYLSPNHAVYSSLNWLQTQLIVSLKPREVISTYFRTAETTAKAFNPLYQ
jgi:hypothetical protein